MSHRRWVPLLLLVAVVIGGGLWLSREERSDATAAAIERADGRDVAEPMLVGKAEPARETPEDARSSGEGSPRRPWETRTGFDLGNEGTLRATGRVMFEDGRPAEGALVWKTYPYRPIFRSAAEAGANDFFVASARTDGEGVYRFSDRQIRTRLRSAAILARHGDLAALLLEPEDDGKLARIPDLVLRPAVHTRIDVVDAYGDPIPGARALLRVHFGGTGIPRLLLGGVGDEQGRLSFLPLPSREDLLLELELRHEHHPDLDADLDVDALRRGEVLRVVMETGRVVRGRILPARAWSPTSFRLYVSGRDAGSDRQRLLEGVRGTPGARGEFELRGVPAAESRLIVWMPPAGAGRDASVMAQVVAIPPGRHGDAVDLGRIRLAPPGKIAGTVTGSDGEPIGNARVSAHLAVRGLTWDRRRTRTDEAGRFVIGQLGRAGYRVEASHEFPRFGRRTASVDGVRPGSAPVELRLTGGSTLVLRFHPAGRSDQPLLLHRYGFEVLRPGGAGEGMVETGAFGGGGFGRTGRSLLRVEFEPGRHAIRFTAKGYRPVVVGPFEITEDADTAIDLELTPE